MRLNELFKKEIDGTEIKKIEEGTDGLDSKKEMTKSELKERERKLALLEEIIKQKGELEVEKQEARELIEKAGEVVRAIPKVDEMQIVCPVCDSTRKDGVWTAKNNPSDSEHIGKALCPMCKELVNWDKIETEEPWFGENKKSCPYCREEAFTLTKEGWEAKERKEEEEEEEDED